MVLVTSAKPNGNNISMDDLLRCQGLVTALHNAKDLPEKCRSYSSVIEAVNQKNNQKNNSSNNDMMTTTDPTIQAPAVRKMLTRRNTSNRVDRRQDLFTDL